jgi:outer membrane protein assembly factor BamB
MRVSHRSGTISWGAWTLRRSFWTAALLSVAVSSAAQPRPPQRIAPDDKRLFPVRLTWTVDLPAEPAAPPITDPLQAYIPLRDGQVVAIALADGWAQWLVDIETTWPVATDGALVFVAADDGVRALRAVDGSEAWRAPVGPVAAPPVSQSGWLIVGTRDGDVRAFRGGDGAVVWKRSLGSPLAAAPAIEGDRLFLPLDDGRLVALEIVRGDPAWERTLGGRPGGILALPDRVFVGTSDNFLYCLAARDGAPDWRWRTAADVTGAPAADHSRVYFVSLDNVLRALDRRTGVQRWRRPLPSRHFGGPQVSAGVVVASLPVGPLLFYAADTGRSAGSLEVPAPLVVAASPVELSPAGGRFLIATIDNTGVAQLHAVGPGGDPFLSPLAGVPGRVLEPEFPLPKKVLFLVLPAPPALPRRGG